MPLTLVTGRANTGKTGVLYGVLREAIAAGSPVTMLLPTMPDVRRAEDELGRHGLVGARVAVLDSWVGELWRLRGDGRRFVTPGARRVLLRRAIEASDPEEVGTSAATLGFARLLADVAQRLPRIPEQPVRGVDAGVARCLRTYHQLAAEAGMIEPGVAAHALAELGPIVDGPLLVNRFTALSESQEALLVGLGRDNEVAVALTWEPDLSATAALDPLVERMFASGAEVLPQVAPPEESELGRLEDRLYCPGEPIAAEGQLAVCLAAGDEAECVLAAQAARGLVDDGFAPERVAVVFRDAGRRLGLLRAAFAAEGVQVDLDVALPVASTPFGSAFTALIDACREPERGRLLALLLSPYVDADASAVAEADAGWRRHRVAGDRLLREAQALGPLTGEAIEAGRRAAQGLSAKSADAWRSAADVLFAAAWARGSADALLDAAAHRTVIGVIDEIAGVEGGRLSLREALEVLAETSAAVGVAERPGAVQVTEAHRLRSRRFDAVVLGGLTADEFSAERPQPLAAEIAERLGAAPGMREREAERMLFYAVATRARQRLVLMRQDCDARGEARRPSVFWDEVVDLYAGEDEAEVPPAPPGIEPKRLGLLDLAAAAPAYAPGRRRERSVAAAFGGSRRRRGVLRDTRVLEALAAADEFSVTELETYLSCPYRWFYERAVRPRELDAEVDARARGSRAHRLLAAFYARLEPELGIRRVVPERLGDALGLFARVATSVEDAAVTRAVGLREELALAQAEQWARSIVTDDAELLPAHIPLQHELAFGTEAGRPFSFGGVRLRGSIDRVDPGPEGLVITDYKSDRQPKGHGSFASARLIQLPVYAAAARELLAAPIAAGVYRSLRSLAMRGFVQPAVDLGERGSDRDRLGPEELEALLGEAAEAVARAAAGIRTGDIRPAANKSACAWCGAAAFCEERR